MFAFEEGPSSCYVRIENSFCALLSQVCGSERTGCSSHFSYFRIPLDFAKALKLAKLGSEEHFYVLSWEILTLE